MIKLWKRIKAYFFLYNLEPKLFISDQSRDKNDLLIDLQQKRILVNKLNKRFKQSLALLFSIVLFFISYLAIQNMLFSEKKVFNQYIEDYTTRLESYGVSGTIVAIDDTEILIALSYIKDGEYNNASILLSNLEGEEAKWLRALCFIRLKKDIAAQALLKKIVEQKGKYSLSAKEMLEKYKQQ